MEATRPTPNVLLVDDDSAELRSLGAALREGNAEWRVELVDDPGRVGLLLESRQIDVVVAGLAGTGIDGVTLLEQVRARQPQAVRIVLTSELDEDQLLRAIPVAHQWLAKPCEPQVLCAAVDRAIRSGSFVHRDDLRAILGHSTALPSVPRLFAEIVRLIADPDVDLRRVLAVVERDPAIAAKILQLANCALYQPERPLVSLREAVLRIGLRTLANCVLAAEMFAALPRADRQTAELIDAAEHRATRQTQLLAAWCEHDPELGPDVRELLPTAGLLHEIGALVLLRFDPLSHRATHRLAERHRLWVDVLERRLIGASHAQIGASLLGTWGLPWPIVDLLANHHDPDRCWAGTDFCSMLSAAEAFVTAPWLVDECGRQAAAHGWGARFARWTRTAEDLLRC